MGQIKSYDTNGLVLAIAKGEESLSRIAARLGLSARYVQQIAQGRARQDLQPRIRAARQGVHEELRRLGASWAPTLLAQHIRQGLEGKNETARRCREFILLHLAMFAPPAAPGPAGAGGAGSGSAGAAKPRGEAPASEGFMVPRIPGLVRLYSGGTLEPGPEDLDADGNEIGDPTLEARQIFAERMRKAALEIPLDMCVGYVGNGAEEGPRTDVVCSRDGCEFRLCEMPLARRRDVAIRAGIIEEMEAESRRPGAT